jgi:cytochrome c biogenesis protein CcmG/thiol:disulfide interchange protein DsbE
MTDSSAGPPPAAPVARKPRKVFLLVGLVLAAALAVGLFTTAGTKKTAGPPKAGGPVPSFSAPRLNGSGTVAVPQDAGSNGTPAVLLFFGAWCTVCKAELPPLAAAARHQAATGGPLGKVRVIGVDSEDKHDTGLAFVKSRGITFPVASDQNIDITSGDFYFEGDPYAVFVKGDGTISAIVSGPLSVAKFTAQEKKLIPSES